MNSKYLSAKLKIIMLPLFILSASAFAGCGDVAGNNSEESGSVFLATNFLGLYNGEEGVNTVDINRGTCDDGTGVLTPEDYFDHFGSVTFTNKNLPNATYQTASTIYINNYIIEYIPVSFNTTKVLSRNFRNSSQTPITDDNSIAPCVIGATCSGQDMTVELVPIELKEDIYDLWVAQASPFDQFVYNVHYTFYGQNVFGKSVQAEAYTFIYALDYNYCD